MDPLKETVELLPFLLFCFYVGACSAELIVVIFPR